MSGTLVIWGAGRIGRGFIADLFHAAGWRLILVDRSQELVESLSRAGRYTVVRAEGAHRQEEVEIAGYAALATTQAGDVSAAIIKADLLAVAVFPGDFADVVGQLASALVARREERPDVPLDVLLCTNLPHPAPEFRQLLQDALPVDARAYGEKWVGIVETLVIRIAPDPPADLRARDPLLVWTNGYPELPVDRHGFRGEVPSVPGLRPVEDMRAEERRKLYTYNTFHAALAYLGALRGHKLIADCMADCDVRSAASCALGEASRALEADASRGFAPPEMACWVLDVIRHTDNPVLGDTVRRFGADPRRKLRREDRLVGPALLARKHGIPPTYLSRAIAAALHFDQAGDPGASYVKQWVETLGVRRAVCELCGLSDDEQDLAMDIARAYDRLPLEAEWSRRAEEARRLGFEYEKVYHGCGQCVLAAVQDALGLFEGATFDAVFNAATGLAGGLGLCGDTTCSAFTAAALIFGLLYPRRRTHFDGDRESKYRAYDLIQRLRDRFTETYGSTRCHDVHRHELGRAFDLRDPAEREAFETAGAHEDKCTGVVARAAQWAVQIIGEERIEDTLRQ
jgi:mannitol-1-phosphate 5-dehydrogenase